MRKSFNNIAFLAALTVLTACNNSKNSKPDESSRELDTVEKKITIDSSIVKKNLEYLTSDALQGRATGSAGIERAAILIEGVFESAGLKPYFRTYRDSFEVEGVTGYNIVGYLEGSDPEIKDEFIIMGAHYDHIGISEPVQGDSIANGANDNAAGTVAVLELAKYFAKNNDTGRSLMFILFSAEEQGLVGAKHISSRLKKEELNLYTMVNFEMIGIPMKDRDFLAYLTGYENSNFAVKFNEYSQAEILGFLPEAKQYNLFERSDNYSFYKEFGVPAQTLSTFDFTNYDYYHHVSDEAQHMNYSHMVHFIESVIPGITAMANTSDKEIKMNQE